MGQRKALREPQLCWNLSFPWASKPVSSGKNIVLVSPAPTASYYSDEYKKCGKFISTLDPVKEWFKTTLSDESVHSIPQSQVRQAQNILKKKKRQNEQFLFSKWWSFSLIVHLAYISSRWRTCSLFFLSTSPLHLLSRR